MACPRTADADAEMPVEKRARPGWFDDESFAESTLRELLDDPLIRTLMRSDGVTPDDVEALFGAVRGFGT